MKFRLNDDSPHELPLGVRGALGRRSGLVKAINSHLLERGDPDIFVSNAQTADFAYLTPGDEIEISLDASGKGLTRQESFLSCFGEVVERYCTYWPEKSLMRKASHSSLSDTDLNVVDYEYLDWYDDDQHHRLTDLIPRWDGRLERDTELWWRRMRALLTGKQVYVPAPFVYFSDDRDTPTHFLRNTNGLAAGPDRLDATLNALYEVVERDAIMTTWFRHRQPTRIALDSDPELVALRSRLASGTKEFIVFEWETPLDIFAVGCTVVDARLNDRRFVLGASASIDIREAIKEAIVEAAQGSIGLRVKSKEYEEQALNPYTFVDFTQNAAYYARSENFSEVKFLLSGETKDISEYGRAVNDQSRKAEFRHCLETLNDYDMMPLVGDLTTRDIRQLDISVVRVVVPELVDLSPPSFPPSRHPRFAGADLYDQPHPFP